MQPHVATSRGCATSPLPPSRLAAHWQCRDDPAGGGGASRLPPSRLAAHWRCWDDPAGGGGASRLPPSRRQPTGGTGTVRRPEGAGART
ncbi:MAG: hypothetical protein U1F76_22860 [Candidatus Competibacteraceae bacterium]